MTGLTLYSTSCGETKDEMKSPNRGARVCSIEFVVMKKTDGEGYETLAKQSAAGHQAWNQGVYWRLNNRVKV